MTEISSVTRPLSETERRLLTGELRRSQRHPCSFRRQLLPTGVVIFGGLWVATVFVAKENRLFATAFWLGIGVMISVWNHLSEKPKYEAAIRRWEDALQRNEAREIRIQSSTFVELEEIEDEGAYYAFQLSDRRIMFVSGQDYYPSARFPNNDFSVVRIFDRENTVIHEFIEKRGSKLAAKRKISAETKSKLKVPGHLQVIEGHVDDLESLLK